MKQEVNISKIVYENKNGAPLAHTKCIVDYEITNVNQERDEIFGNTPSYEAGSDYYITPNDNTDSDQVLKGIWDQYSGAGRNLTNGELNEFKGYFWIRAIVYHNKIGDGCMSNCNQNSVIGGTIVLLDEVKFWVDIIDPCVKDIGETNSIVNPTDRTEPIPDMIFVVNGATVSSTKTSETITFWKDKASIEYGYGKITEGSTYS